ncbi:MAG: hypothetical protein ACRDLB_12785, partial [Actinomycetota bacterium]
MPVGCAHFGTDIFVHDTRTGRTDRVSVEPWGGEINRLAPIADGGHAGTPSISGDGSHVAFMDVCTTCDDYAPSAYWRPDGAYTHLAVVDLNDGSVAVAAGPPAPDTVRFDVWETLPDLSSDGRY